MTSTADQPPEGLIKLHKEKLSQVRLRLSHGNQKRFNLLCPLKDQAVTFTQRKKTTTKTLLIKGIQNSNNLCILSGGHAIHINPDKFF